MYLFCSTFGTHPVHYRSSIIGVSPHGKATTPQLPSEVTSFGDQSLEPWNCNPDDVCHECCKLNGQVPGHDAAMKQPNENRKIASLSNQRLRHNGLLPDTLFCCGFVCLVKPLNSNQPYPSEVCSLPVLTPNVFLQEFQHIYDIWQLRPFFFFKKFAESSPTQPPRTVAARTPLRLLCWVAGPSRIPLAWWLHPRARGASSATRGRSTGRRRCW